MTRTKDEYRQGQVDLLIALGLLALAGILGIIIGAVIF